MKYHLNRFEGYTLEDCDCALCLHYAGRGKPCPLDVCCCAAEKREAIERMRKSSDLPPLRRRLNPLQPERPVCFNSLECVGCTYPAHGFICGVAGDCLKTAVAAQRRTPPCPA